MPSKNPCSELAKTVTMLAMHVGARPEVKSLADVVTALEKDLPGITRDILVNSINEATTGHAAAKTELQKKLGDLRREARTDVGLRQAVVAMERHVKAGTRPAPVVKKASPKEIQEVRAKIRELRQQLTVGDPKARERVKARIAELDALIAKGEPPTPRERKAAPADLQALRDERDAKYRQAKTADPARRKVLEDRIAELEKHIKDGTLPPDRPEPPAAPADIQALRDKRDTLRRELDARARDADPAVRDDLRQQIKDLDAHIAAGTVPAKSPTRPVPADVAALRAERDAKAAQAAKADPALREKLRKDIAELDAHLKAGTVPAKPTPKPTGTPADLAALKQQKADLLAEVMKADPAKRDAIRAKIREIQKHLTDGTFPDKVERPPAPADLQKLRDERDALAAELRRNDPKIRADIQQQIADLEGHLKAGTLPPKPEAKPDNTPADVMALRESRDALQAALAKSEPALREKYQQQIDDLTTRLEDGVELPGPKPEAPALSKELERMVYQRDRLKAEIRQRINDLKPKTIWQRAGYAVGEPLNAARSLMTSFDFSAVLRQGSFIALGNPVRAAKALGPMFRAFASPAASHRINTEILNRPNAPAYARSGLYLAPDSASSLSAKEEAFMSKWADKIPGVASSQRAYVTFLNQLRADSFDAMVNTLSRGGMATEPEMKAISNYINVATGRGNLGGGKIEQAAPVLNTIFFAPRYVASRFQMLGMQPMIGGTMRTRKLIAQEYAKYVAGLGVVYMLGTMAGGEVEKDPKSSDFGKLRFGDTRLDPLAGLSQAGTLVTRLAYGQRVDKKGRVVALDGKGKYNTRGTIAQDFMRSKMSPAAGTVYDYLYNELPDRSEFSWAKAGKNLALPMQADTLYETFEEQGIPKATALGILSIFGMGVNTYK